MRTGEGAAHQWQERWLAGPVGEMPTARLTKQRSCTTQQSHIRFYLICFSHLQA